MKQRVPHTFELVGQCGDEASTLPATVYRARVQPPFAELDSDITERLMDNAGIVWHDYTRIVARTGLATILEFWLHGLSEYTISSFAGRDASIETQPGFVTPEGRDELAKRFMGLLMSYLDSVDDGSDGWHGSEWQKVT